MVQLLREWFPIYPTAAVAAALDLSYRAVAQKAASLGLRKSPEYLASQASGRIQRGRTDPRLIATQIKPGSVPWNKGMKGLCHEGSKPTQFKKGCRPHTWLPIGSYRVVPGGSGHTTLILEKKVNDLPGPNHVRWHPVHRLVWEAANGPVPAGHIVVFKPGMRTVVLEEITLDRVELITRAENARRNHPRSRDPELGRLVQLKGAITRQVNRIAREAQEKAS